MLINDNSDEAMKEMEKVVSGRMTRFGETWVEHAVAGSPYDTGHNRRSIALVVDQGRGPKIERGQEVDGPIPSGDVPELGKGGMALVTQSGYGAYLELGTAKMPAQPYIEPAFQTARRELDRER